MATKYIVNNLDNQTIGGNVIINGNLTVTGITTNNLSRYKALFTQTGSMMGTDIAAFNYSLIIGETYTIDNYVSPDDFSNVANVQSGDINTTGCVFIATGSTPTSWGEGTQITSSGFLIVDVLENSLGYNIDWVHNALGGTGNYIGVNDLFILQNNTFPRNKVSISTQLKEPLDWPGYPYIDILPSVQSFMATDNILSLDVYDWDVATPVDNALYYTPVEINILQDMTPLVVSGDVTSSYPIDNVSVRTYCDGSTIDTYYGNMDDAANITQVISILNSDSELNYIGTYSDPGDGGILLTMSTHNASFFCPTGTITFEVFSD